MGIVLIIIGMLIALYWASDLKKGEKDTSQFRTLHTQPMGGCLPYAIAIGLIGLGIYLLL